MPTGKMHIDEVDTDIPLVKRLLAGQFPQWAQLPIEPVRSAGTDNAIYRLGDTMVVRLPRIHWATGQVEKEHTWLPKLAPLLPVAIPAPIEMGEPGEGYPWNWSIYRWLEGENATPDHIVDMRRLITDVAQFITSLRKVDTTGAPLSTRGVPLATRDEGTRAALASLGSRVDGRAITSAWEAALDAPAWQGPPVWSHGDLQSGNLLVVEDSLSAVIDFGCLGVGDPACDLMLAWTLLSPETRELFRTEMAADEAMWARGRGWALSVALYALPYYQTSNPVLAGISRRAINEVLADHSRGI